MKSITFTVVMVFCATLIFGQMWEEIAPMPDDFRTDHSIGFALNGKGYVATGGNISFTPSGVQSLIYANVYQYDPSTDEWTELEPHPGGARGYGIGDVYDGKAYMGFGIGVDGQPLNDLWVFDGETWEELTPCACPGRLHPSFTINNGKIFVGLGNNNNGNLNDWWVYDIEKDEWKQLPNLPGDRRHHPFQFSLGDFVYAGFGHGPSIYNDWYLFDPVEETWTEVASLPGEGRVAGAQFEYNGLGYILSGEGEDHFPMVTGEFWKYDPDLDFWDQLTPHPGWSRWAPATFLIDGYIYLINGSVRNAGYEYPDENHRYFLGESTSAQEVEISMQATVYPNPVSDVLLIDYPELFKGEIQRIEIIDQMGKTLFVKDLEIDNINVKSLPVGKYHLFVTTSEGTYVKSFIKS